MPTLDTCNVLISSGPRGSDLCGVSSEKTNVGRRDRRPHRRNKLRLSQLESVDRPFSGVFVVTLLTAYADRTRGSNALCSERNPKLAAYGAFDLTRL
jgi:hypothetical protein